MYYHKTIHKEATSWRYQKLRKIIHKLLKNQCIYTQYDHTFKIKESRKFIMKMTYCIKQLKINIKMNH